MAKSPYTTLDASGHTENGMDIYDCRVWCNLCAMAHCPCELDDYGAEVYLPEDPDG